MHEKNCKNMLTRLLFLLCLPIVAQAGIVLDPSISSSDVEITQLTVAEVVYDVITVNGYQNYPAVANSGDPLIPSIALNFLLPTDQQIDEIEIVSMEWDTIPGTFYLYPVQNESMEDSTFILPNPDIYLSENHWPDSPVEVISQGGMMGVGVATILTTPMRYIPSDSMLLVLAEITLSIEYGTSQFEIIVPVGETSWSSDNRIQGILASIQNPGDYRSSSIDMMRRDTDNQAGPLAITDVPSLNGDGVDFVIITTAALADDWQVLADIRTKQGIITVVRSVEWIESEYAGCDTQEKIKNFITDAYEFWGTGVVLLGGDHELVPSRMCEENQSGPYKSYPSDSYFSEVDGDDDWLSPSGYWYQTNTNILLDVSVGRVPVDNSEMVELFIDKLQVYENPSSLPAGFARRALFIGDSAGSGGDGLGASKCEALNQDLIAAGIAGPSGQYLNTITELYWPATGYAWSGDELSRNAALDAIDDGQNIIFHISHSGTHQMGAQAATSLPVRQYLTEGDMQDLENSGMPGILLSNGCWPGHFQGAECIIERGLFSSDEAGLIAGMAFAKSGGWSDPTFFFNELANALYEYEPYASGGSLVKVGPYVYLGECYRHMLNNMSQGNERHMNLLGDPSMFVWRGNAIRPTVSAFPSTVTAGTFSTTVHVAEMGIALPRAKVCLYKEDELFAIGTTDLNGNVTFNSIQATTAGPITVTVIKRKAGIDIANYLPATTSITVNQNTGALLSFNALNVDDDDISGSYGNDDEEINPGETIKFDLVVDNTGQSSATNASATLSIISGSDQIENQIDMTQYLGTVTVGTTTYTGAFALEIADDVDGSDPVILRVAFSYDQGSKNCPADFRVLVGETDLPVRTMTITQGNPLVINIDDMFLTNAGLGNLEDVEVEFKNPSGGVTFLGDLTESFGDLDNCSGEEVEDGIRATLRNPSGCWNPITSSATFDLEISHRWGSETITVNAYDVLQQGTVQPPNSSSLDVLSATDDLISLEWGNPAVTADGWYLWKRASGVLYWTRFNTLPLDGTLRHGLIDNLAAGTEYAVGVSVIGEYGQESAIASMNTSTTCDEVADWPVYLDGGTGTGPAISDIDGDGYNEVIAATTAGSVYIVESNGTATRIYDSPYLFSGVAIGNVLVGGRDEIVVSGWDYDVVTGKKAVVVVLSWSQIPGWTGTEINAASGGSQRIHENMSVPVLFNADNSGSLEIALRTFSGSYDDSEYSWLYVWEYVNSQWVCMSNFPKTFPNAEYDYAPPVYIGDTDSDNYPELVVSKGKETLYWIEPETDQYATWNVGSAFPATYSGTTMNWNLGQSLMNAVREGSTTKLVVVGRHSTATDYSSSSGYYSTACLNASNGGSGIWYTSVNESWDPWGIFGGPALGDIDGDDDLDIANQWIPKASEGGIVEYLTLANGTRTTLSDMPYNTHGEDRAMSPVVIAGEEGDGLASFGSLSTVSQGSIIDNGTPEFIAGSSYWSEDRMTSTPAVGNIDQDSDLEVIFGDDSGFLYALDMDLNPSSADWPMLQHDLQRTGYFNFSAKGGFDTSLDFQIVDVSSENASVLSEGNRTITVNVAISGTEDTDSRVESTAIAVEPRTSALVISENNSTSARIPTRPGNSISVASEDAVTVAVFSGSRMLNMRRIPLVDGRSSVVLSLSEEDLNGEVTVAVDPFGEYQEADESNNAISIGTANSCPIEEISVTSASAGIRISVPAGILSHESTEARLFSIDGRLVSSCTVEINAGEGCLLSLTSNGGSLPFGCYVILLNDGEDLLLRRKVLVID